MSKIQNNYYTPSSQCVANALQSHPKIAPVLSSYGYQDGHFTRDLNKSMVRQLIKVCTNPAPSRFSNDPFNPLDPRYPYMATRMAPYN